jgi:hypothetical protein
MAARVRLQASAKRLATLKRSAFPELPDSVHETVPDIHVYVRPFRLMERTTRS